MPPDDENELRTASSAGHPTARTPRWRGGHGAASALPYLVSIVVTLLVAWFAFALITGTPVGLTVPKLPIQTVTSTTPVVLTINNPFDTENNSSADQFSPANFTVPSHTLLEMTFINYDKGQNPVTTLEATVSGSVGNCVYLNATPTALGQCVHALPTGFVTHTFSFVSGAYAGFNIPIPSAVNSAPGGIGASVTFFAYFNQTGTFTWNCIAPCDPWSMQTNGFMTGTMTVT
ncbi:MAG: hypothetical protein L3K19_03465 [Thermoplasmata archaeon]|nr:hypothetical protein [Thermoplasmata archaeon]